MKGVRREEDEERWMSRGNLKTLEEDVLGDMSVLVYTLIISLLPVMSVSCTLSRGVTEREE